MGIIDSVVSFLRHPIDTIQQAVCEASPQSNSCSTLTAFAQAMDGNQARSLAASTFHAEALPQAPRAPETRVGCSFQVHEVHRFSYRLREELLRPIEFKRIELSEMGMLCLFCLPHELSPSRAAEGGAREVRVGCSIQHMVSRPIRQVQELSLPRRMEVRETQVGCSFQVIEMRDIPPLSADAGVAAPARRRH